MKRFHVGVDIVSVKRIGEALAKHPSFATKFLNDDEIPSPPDVKRLAARWAAKEALFKAFGNGKIKVTYKDFSLRRLSNGAIHVDHPYSDWEISLSISHEDDYAIAYCMIQKNQAD